MKANKSIRSEIVKNGLKYWEVASQIGISPGTFTVWLRTQLDETKESKVKAGIKELAEVKKET